MERESRVLEFGLINALKFTEKESFGLFKEIETLETRVAGIVCKGSLPDLESTNVEGMNDCSKECFI